MPDAALRIREYGDGGRPHLILIHGGPGAAGYLEPVARVLATSYRVIEPFQRGSGDRPLTVDRHIEDLLEGIRDRCGDRAPGLIGHSWGAMLALAYAAAHPERTGPIVIIGCGTFDHESRSHMTQTVESRIEGDTQNRLERLAVEIPDEDVRMRAIGDLLLPAYSSDPIENRVALARCDARAHRESWADMVRLQEEGRYPGAFSAIRSPVLMLHGDHDPHPGGMIRDGLARHIPHLEYRELPRCGHYPWLERQARAQFLAIMREWLYRHLCTSERC